jgi:hypothetical protein
MTLLSILLAFSLAAASVAAQTFTIDPDQSKVTASGNIAGFAIMEQGPGSLVSSYDGQLKVELSSSTIHFLTNSFIDARINGTWQPAPGGADGNGPADFGGQANVILTTAKGAFRNLVLDLSSDILPVANSQFDASKVLFTFATNTNPALLPTFDYNAGFIGSGSKTLSGLSSNVVSSPATIAATATTQTITIPVKSEFKFSAQSPDDSTLTLTGQIVATRALPQEDFKVAKISIKNGIVTLHVSGEGSANVRVETSTDLVNWSPVSATAAQDQNGELDLTVAASGPIAFYRLVEG